MSNTCQIDEMLDMLKRLQWYGYAYGPQDHYCTVCNNLRRHGHSENCELAALIAKAEKEVQG